MARLFYARQPLPAPGGTISITGEEARHAAVVTRLRPGEIVHIADGSGERIIGPVLRADRELVEVRAEQRERDPEASPALLLAQALAKGGRDELALQAATELGAAGIVPWQAARSVVRWRGEKAQRGHERWAVIAREAAKQSMRATIPEVLPAADAAGIARLHDPGAGTIVAVLDPAAPATLASACGPGGTLRDAARIVLVIGPEGGIAPGEHAIFSAAGCPGLRLGSPVLRTSTAGPAAITAVRVLLGGWA